MIERLAQFLGETFREVEPTYFCPRCGEKLELLTLDDFVDPTWGIRAQRLECPHCDYFVPYESHKEAVK